MMGCSCTYSNTPCSLIVFFFSFILYFDVLLWQQYETIKVHTDVDVQYCCGAKAVDARSIASWQKEVSTYQVMVMTPQILLDVPRKGFLNLDMVHLMVIDECHHALGNHPYNRLMKEFYHKSVLKPHIFGMTASPILRKGKFDAIDEYMYYAEAKLRTMAFGICELNWLKMIHRDLKILCCTMTTKQQ
ncbi:unnamed protein product [Musa acuminata subsp. malaccensis]|uniref:(wild Malaysian banana) hypothetical protein n=1 Tax=Musa acuminata subsp. malaccensis TaxID=214687 RepID=A0A804L165_MUSAM|nr:unnamed protein product [Musa acuminata subsp. malaccensis]